MKQYNNKLISTLVALLIIYGCKDSQLPKNKVNIAEKNGHRYISSNGIPDHETGEFPNRHDPVAIAEQKIEFRVPLTPTKLDKPMNTNGYEVGIAVNGIQFDPNGPFYIDGEEKRAIRNPFEGIKSGWQYEGLSENVDLGHDHNNAHVQPPGLYHYHGVPKLLIIKLQKKQSEKMVLLGYAADGFPIYNNLVPSVANDLSSSLINMKSGYRLKSGKRPENPPSLPKAPTGNYDGTFIQDYEYIESISELDKCNGRFGVSKEYPKGTYYYVITENWPFVPRYFNGIPDESFRFLPKEIISEIK